MSDFDLRARDWDKNKMHTDRAVAIASHMQKMVHFNKEWKAMEFGAGTALLSFLLNDEFSEITLLDNSLEMIKVCEEKCESHQTLHIHPKYFDLETQNLNQAFDFIYSQMALHHVIDIRSIFTKFYSMLNQGGYIAIADLYTEDGSFHGEGVKVHKGFDPKYLVQIMVQIGFKSINFETCYNLSKENGKTYPIFLIVGQK